MTTSPDLVPVPVYLHNVEALAALFRTAPKKPIRYVSFRTFHLTAANPVQDICSEDPGRVGILVQAFTNDVVLCETMSKAQDPANSATANPGFPEGYLVAKANTTPTWLPSTDLVWITAGTMPALLTVCLITEVPHT